jgi:hypothetical protein
MDDKLALDEFIHNWRASRVIALGGAAVARADREQLFERGACELFDFGDPPWLSRTAGRGGAALARIVGYVKAPYDSAEHRATQGPVQGDIGWKGRRNVALFSAWAARHRFL